MQEVKHLGKNFYVDAYVTGVQSTHPGQYIQRQLQTSLIIAKRNLKLKNSTTIYRTFITYQQQYKYTILSHMIYNNTNHIFSPINIY